MTDAKILDMPMEFGLELMSIISSDFPDTARELVSDIQPILLKAVLTIPLELSSDRESEGFGGLKNQNHIGICLSK
jgi:hypothetical protein